MTVIDAAHAPTNVQPNRTQRVGVVAIAMTASLAVWLAGRVATGEVLAPSYDDSAPLAIPAPQMMISAAIAGLLGWGLLAVLERFTSKAQTVWTAVAVIVLVLSLGTPFSGNGIELGNQLVLAAAHVVVGTILILGLPRAKTAAATT